MVNLVNNIWVWIWWNTFKSVHNNKIDCFSDEKYIYVYVNGIAWFKRGNLMDLCK